MKSKINNFLEYLPFLINKKLSFFLTQIGELENLFSYHKNLQIKKPIFICGLARSGTTAVLNLLNNHSETGSFENQDLPFTKTLFFLMPVFISARTAETYMTEVVLPTPPL